MKNNTTLKKIPDHQLGNFYKVESNCFNGLYWEYTRLNKYSFEVHDLFITKETLADFFTTDSNGNSLAFAYIVNATGEAKDPYSPIHNRLSIISRVDFLKENIKLYANSNFKAVLFNFNKQFLFDNLSSEYHSALSKENLYHRSFALSGVLEPIVKELTSGDISPEEAPEFFDSKVEEWLDIFLKDLVSPSQTIPLSSTDIIRIHQVAEYLTNHFNVDIKQELLAKIACMSVSKLKMAFSTYYGCSITEFVQRKRIDAAEILLVRTDLEVKDIASIVGYSSPSRFTQLYRRQKGITPSENRSLKRNVE